MAQNHLALAFSHEDVYLFNKLHEEIKRIDPDYVVYDLRMGQNANNYFPLTKDEARDTVNYLRVSGDYCVYFQKDQMYILEKKPCETK